MGTISQQMGFSTSPKFQGFSHFHCALFLIVSIYLFWGHLGLSSFTFFGFIKIFPLMISAKILQIGWFLFLPFEFTLIYPAFPMFSFSFELLVAQSSFSNSFIHCFWVVKLNFLFVYNRQTIQKPLYLYLFFPYVGYISQQICKLSNKLINSELSQSKFMKFFGFIIIIMLI